MDNTKKSSGSSRVGILDELRGFAIICMVVYHAMYDLKYLFGLDIPIFFDGWFDVIRDIFAGLFIFISGTVCRYSSNNIKRGAQCFFIGMIMTFVMPFFTSGTVMFGILHFLGVSMMLFGLGQKLFDLLPSWVGIGVCVLLFILTMNVRLTYANGMISPGYIGIPNLFAIKLPMEAYNVGVLFPLGLHNASFSSSDYFPMMPWFFLFLAGSYRSSATRPTSNGSLRSAGIPYGYTFSISRFFMEFSALYSIADAARKKNFYISRLANEYFLLTY